MQDTLAIAVGGRAAGTYYQGDRRFDIVVRLPESVRESIPALRKLPIALPKADGQAQTPTSRCPRSPAWTCRPAPTRSRARTASAAS